MGRIIKVVGIVAGGIVVLLVAAAVIVGFLFDPNDYKQEITDAVADATGRQLDIPGQLELELFPNIRVAMGAASLSNADGFNADTFASIEGATLRVQLLPLLSGRVSIGEARLEGLVLNLERDGSGGNNWQDLSGGDAPAAEAAQDSGAPSGSASDFDLGIDEISIVNARVSWRDASAGSDWLLTNFSMEADGFGLASSFPLEIGFDFAGPDINVSVEAEMEALLDLEANAYRLDNLQVSIDGEGAAWPGGEGRANVGFTSFTANLDQESVVLEGLALEILGLEISGNLRGENLFDDLALNGGIEIGEFDPNDLLSVFDTQIETADSSVFRRASASAEFVYNSRRMGMENTRISLDDSTLTGSVGYFGEELRFDLDVDAINIDRYLPPATEGEQAGTDEGSVDEIDLPLDPLRDFRANGSLSLGQTQFMNLTMTDAMFTLTAANGRLRLVPTAALYGGTIRGEIAINVAGDSADFSLEQALAGVDMHSLATDYLGTEDLSGTGRVNLDLESSGSNLGDIRKSLTGTASFALTDGAWEGIDAWYELRRARAVTQRNPSPEREGPPRTTFSRVSASGVVADGVLTTNDLNATLPFMALNGTGTVGLFDNALDFKATASLVDGPTLQSDPAMAELAGASLPLTVGGTLDAPSIRPDFGAIIRQQVQSAVQERIDEEREEAREEVREEVQERVRDRLRGLFDR